MKRLALTVFVATTAGAAFGHSAASADLSTKAPAYKAVPAVTPTYSWSGCYIGGQAGGGWSHSNWTNRVSEVPWADFNPGDGISYHASGWIGGGQLGCNYQIDRQWVLGIEGTIAGAGIKGSRLDTVFGQQDDTYSNKITALYTITGRLGYAWNDWMLYGKGGFASARVDWAAVDTSGVNQGAGQASLWHQGWTVGAGLDHALSSGFIVGIEYGYVGLNAKTGQFGDTTGSYLNDVTPSHIHTVVGRLSYKFSGPFGR